jgi:hypothetical protein
VGSFDDFQTKGQINWDCETNPGGYLNESIWLKSNVFGGFATTGIIMVDWVSFLDFVGMDVDQGEGIIVHVASTVCDVLFSFEPRIFWTPLKNRCSITLRTWLKIKATSPAFPQISVDLTFTAARQKGENATFYTSHLMYMLSPLIRAIPWTMDYTVPEKPKHWWFRKRWRKIRRRIQATPK